MASRMEDIDDFTWTTTSASTDSTSSTTSENTNWKVADWKRHYQHAKPRKEPESEVLIEKKNPSLDDILKYN